MSADNGVYILRTEGPEYRIKHLQAVENLYWDEHIGGETQDRDVWIVNAREMWKGCEVFTDMYDALNEAHRIYEEIMSDDFCPICEYGICSITIGRKF